MSEEQLKAFIEKVKADTSLQEKLKAAADTNAVVAIAKEAGFSISAEDYASELSDEELEGAAGAGGIGDDELRKYGKTCVAAGQLLGQQPFFALYSLMIM